MVKAMRAKKNASSQAGWWPVTPQLVR